MQDLARGLPVAFTLWVFAVGAVVGSFLNVVIARVPKGRSIVSPGSRCPRCGSPIAWYDNIPVLSWILLRARCRIQESTGILSYQAIGLPQRGHRLPGETMLRPFGTRAITTLRKLPTTAPTAKTQSVNATGRPRARSCI